MNWTVFNVYGDPSQTLMGCSDDDDCDDGLFCNGEEACMSGVCAAGTPPCTGDTPACDEAGDYVLGELPGDGKPNYYYWYYATLATYQLQGEHWRRWNDALQRTLLDSQETAGAAAGSWSPESVWGGYGGRVYTTALAALCLEVYYRYLPLYVEELPETRDVTADRRERQPR